MDKYLIAAITLLIAANSMAWFQVNLQFISEWRYNKPLLTIFTFSIPTTFCFYFGWRFLVESYNQEIWTARVVSFSISIILFWLFSYIFKLQPLNLKVGICIALSFLIILIQSFWPDSHIATDDSCDVEETSEEL